MVDVNSNQAASKYTLIKQSWQILGWSWPPTLYTPELPYDKHSTYETIQDTSAVEECTFSN